MGRVQPPTRSRIRGIDVARALAILGMVMVHFGPFSPSTDTLLGWAYRTSYGRASTLFVLLAGIGVTLLFGTGERRKDPRRAWTKVAWRVVVFLPAGIALQWLDTPVAVILHYYAAYYVLGAAAQHLPTRWLLALTGTWTLVGTVVYVSAFDISLAGRGTADDPFNPVLVIGDLLATGFYPLITWAPPVLVGVLVGRTRLEDTATRWALVGGGTVTAAAAYGLSEIARATSAAAADSMYLVAEGHTGAPLNVVGATAVAVAVLGACLLLADALPRLTWPLAMVGQMALTVYVGHLLVLDVAPQWLESRDDLVTAVWRVARFFLVVLGICSLWRLRWRRGPLEALLALPFEHRPTPTVSTAWPPPTQSAPPTGPDRPRPVPSADSSALPRSAPSWTQAPTASSPWTPTSGSWSGTPPPSP